MKKRTAIVVCGLAIIMMLISCGKKEAEPDQANAGMKNAQSASASEAAKAAIKGQTITVDQFKLTIPNDWTGDKDTQVWYPNTEDSNIPIPPHCLHCGARPLMGNPSFEEAIQQHIGTAPTDKNPVKVGNMQGIECKWQQGSYKSVGLFLLEKSVGMDIMYFFICQAPATDFDQYLETYRGILNSVSLK